MAKDFSILNQDEVGTEDSGFSEGGPFSCMNCEWRTPHSQNAQGELVDSCSHPKVMKDAKLQSKKLPDGTIEVGWDDCCRFVRPPGTSDVIALVLRHGDTELNEEKRLRSRLDVPLDEKGVSQADEAAKFIIQNYPDIKRIYVAPLQRVIQTVTPIAQALKIQPQVVEELNTWDMGVLIGEKKDEVKDVLNMFVKNSDKPIPGGESLKQHVGDLMNFIEPALEEAEEDGPILIAVTSSSIIPLMKIIEGTPIEEQTDSDSIGPGGMFAISKDGDGYKMEPVHGEKKKAEVGAS